MNYQPIRRRESRAPELLAGIGDDFARRRARREELALRQEQERRLRERDAADAANERQRLADERTRSGEYLRIAQENQRRNEEDRARALREGTIDRRLAAETLARAQYPNDPDAARRTMELAGARPGIDTQTRFELTNAEFNQRGEARYSPTDNTKRDEVPDVRETATGSYSPNRFRYSEGDQVNLDPRTKLQREEADRAALRESRMPRAGQLFAAPETQDKRVTEAYRIARETYAENGDLNVSQRELNDRLAAIERADAQAAANEARMTAAKRPRGSGKPGTPSDADAVYDAEGNLIGKAPKGAGKLVRSQLVFADQIGGLTQDLIGNYNKYGVKLNPTSDAYMERQAMSSQLLGLVKGPGMLALGAITGPDKDIIDGIIGTDWEKLGGLPAAKLRQLQGVVDRQTKKFLLRHGIKPMESAPANPEQAAQASQRSTETRKAAKLRRVPDSDEDNDAFLTGEGY